MTARRHRKPKLTEAELFSDTCPSRVTARDVAACADMPISTVLADLRSRALEGWKRSDALNAPWYVSRENARAYVARMNGRHAA